MRRVGRWPLPGRELPHFTAAPGPGAPRAVGWAVAVERLNRLSAPGRVTDASGRSGALATRANTLENVSRNAS